MAPSTTTTQSLSAKVKRPIPPGIQTNGIKSSTSSPSPSMSAGRLPNSAKNPPNSATSNGIPNSSTAGPRSANRIRREPSNQLLGRGQRNASGGLRSGSLAVDAGALQAAGPIPYIKTDEYILKKYRGHTPSLVIHLHPTHFRFDNQEGSFTYKSPMRIVLEHLRERTIPHDLVELMDVPFYEGCMIVQIHDHKSIAPSQDPNRQVTASGKVTPFSVHNYNTFLTPSSYVPYPKQSPTMSRTTIPSEGENGGVKTADQRDKENMPAPALPDANRNKSSNTPRKARITTIVLHPTPLSNHFEFGAKAADVVANQDGRRDSRSDLPGSATVPPTPSTAIPPTPAASILPPAKRLKKGKAEAETANLYLAESQITFTTTAPLTLDIVDSAAQSAALLKSLAHPMHLEKPPSPKTRKRTVAEMAADEALAADQERYMLLFDERLSSGGAGAPGANPNDGDGQAGSSSFEPRFERFKALENIKNTLEEKARVEKLRVEEAERKAHQDRERDRLRAENERREAEKAKTTMDAQRQAQAQAQARAHAQAQELQRRQQMSAQAHAQNVQNMQGHPQVQHAHPQANGLMANGIQGQPQRFHQQQVSQAQVSSPIVRNGTPQNHSSPMNGNMGNVPMQHSNSSIGGSPARPGSVVHQNHPPMAAPTSHAMTAQRSQQSHAGTPRIQTATPNIQNTPLNRQMSQTPRMGQASPLPGQVPQQPQMMMLPNGQQISAQQQQAFMQARANQQRMAAMAQQNPQMMNGVNAANPAMQQQLQLLQQQQRAMAAAAMNPNYSQQMAAAMAARQAQAQAGNVMNQNFMNGGQNMQQQVNMTSQQMQAMQQMQMQNQQANIQRAAQAQAAAQNQQQVHAQQQVYAQQVMRLSNAMYQEKIQTLHQQYPQGIPDEIDRQLRVHCQQQASLQVRQRRQQQIQQQQQQMMAAQNMNGMQNGMPNGMQNGMQNGMSM